MAEIVLQNRSGTDGIMQPGRFGRATGPSGVLVGERHPLGLSTLMARRNRRDDLATAVRLAFGIELPPPGSATFGPRIDLIGCGLDQWLALSADESASEEHLRAKLEPYASVADQSDGRIILRLSGPRVRETLAKGLSLDLHPRVFGPGSAAVTAVSHVRIEFWQETDQPAYSMAVPRSSFKSFWDWLAASAAEFGLDVANGK